MWAASDAELDELIGDLARMGLQTSQIMISASAALLQDDSALAEQVVARGDDLDELHHVVEDRCLARLALHDPVTPDPGAVLAALDAVRDLQQMGDLAQHTAKIAQLTQPYLIFLPEDVRTVLAQMGLLASGLARQAAIAIDELDPWSADRLVQAGDEVDALRRQLLGIVFAENWSHGVGPAVQAALVGRYYECFADHALAIARLVGSLATDQIPARPALAGDR